MNGLRFKVGDLAVYVVPWHLLCQPYVGQPCEVVRAGGVSVIEGRIADYELRFSDGAWLSAFDWQLRKLDPPAEPVEMTRVEEVGV